MSPPPPPPPTEEWYQAATPPSTTAQTAAAVAAEAALRAAADTAAALVDSNALTAAQALDVLKTAHLVVATVVGAEGAVAANTIEVACTIKDRSGNTVTGVREVMVETLAVTSDKGDIAAAGTPVGTLVKVNNPATGRNAAWFTTTSGGIFTFSVADDQVESVICCIIADGCDPKLVKLTFA